MTHLLPTTGIGYAAIIFVLSACTVVVITFQLLMVVRCYKVISTILLSLQALLFVFVLGSVFNEFYNRSTKENHSCDPKFLEKRSDDNEKVLRNRFKTYQEETAPILNHYKKQNLFTEIDGMQKIDEIYSKIREIIHPLKT